LIDGHRSLIEASDRKADPQRWSTTDWAASLFLLGFTYSLVLGGLAFRLAGAGHGSGFFLAVCLPGLVLWPAAALASEFGNGRIGRWICPGILFFQYLLGIDTMALTDAPDRDGLGRMWDHYPGVILFFSTFFLIGQAGIWCVYAIKRRKARGAVSRNRVTLAEAMMVIVIVALLMAMVAIPARWIFSRT
jgi:hypothetical protein